MIKTSIRKDQLTKFITEAEKPKKKETFRYIWQSKNPTFTKKKKILVRRKKKKRKEFPFWNIFSLKGNVCICIITNENLLSFNELMMITISNVLFCFFALIAVSCNIYNHKKSQPYWIHSIKLVTQKVWKRCTVSFCLVYVTCS